MFPRSVKLAAAFRHRLDRVASQVVNRPCHAGLVEARDTFGVDVDLELDRSPIHLEPELPGDVGEKLLQIHLANEDVAFAAGKLQNLALHRGQEIELFEDQLRVLAAFLFVGSIDHQLHVAADHRHRSLEVVDHLRQEPPDRGQTLAFFPGRIRAE